MILEAELFARVVTKEGALNAQHMNNSRTARDAKTVTQATRQESMPSLGQGRQRIGKYSAEGSLTPPSSISQDAAFVRHARGEYHT